MIPPHLEFWYDFASTYSYLSAMRLRRLAADEGVEVEWRPFLLGPIFGKNGWTTSPFNLYPARGRYMWRDMERLTEAMGLPLVQPDPFPQTSLLPARCALALPGGEVRARFTEAVFAAEFGEGADISDSLTLIPILAELGGDPDAVLAATRDETIKTALRLQTETADAAGIFGAPTFITGDGEMFWGNDRLEQAIVWAKRHVPETV